MATYRRRPLNVFSEWLLRLAIIAFLFSVLFAMDFGEEPVNKFLDGFIGILKLIIFSGISVLLIVFSKQLFKYTAFLVLMIASLYRFLLLIGMDVFQWESFTYLLVFFLAFYGLSRSVPRERKPFRK